MLSAQGTEECVEAAIELALEIAGWSFAGFRRFRMQLLQRLLELLEVDLYHSERAFPVEHADEQEFLLAGYAPRHEDLTLSTGVVHFQERLSVQLAPELACRRVDCR